MVQVMELMTGGELYDRVVAKGKFDEEQTRRVVTSVARALQYCHAMGIVHRDLKVSRLLCRGRRTANGGRKQLQPLHSLRLHCMS